MTNEKYNAWNSFKSGFSDAVKPLFYDGKGVAKTSEGKHSESHYKLGQGAGIAVDAVTFALGFPVFKSGYNAVKNAGKEAKANAHRQAVIREKANIARKFR